MKELREQFMADVSDVENRTEENFQAFCKLCEMFDIDFSDGFKEAHEKIIASLEIRGEEMMENL